MPKEFANAQDLVAVKEIRDSALVMKDGGLRQVLMVNGLNFALRSEVEQNTITAGYQNFLNTLDFPLQIIIHSRKINVAKYLEKLAVFEQSEPTPILRSQNAEYREFIRGFVEKNAIMEKTFFVVVPWITVSLPTTKGLLRFIPFLKKNEAAKTAEAEEKEETFTESLEQLSERTSQVTEGLGAIGLEAVILGNRELAEMLYNFYNPESVERENLNLPAEEKSKS